MMRRNPASTAAAALLLGVSLLAACGRAPDATHAGTWELDVEVIRSTMRAELAQSADPIEQHAMQLGMAMLDSGMLDALRMDLVLNADGTASSTTSMMGESETVRGTWSARGNQLSIEMTQDGQSELVSAVVRGDTLELIPPPGEEMPFPVLLRKRAD